MATYSSDPVLYLYTSLTSGSSHIITATSRLETILRANRIPFKGLDVATDEKARMLWGRRAGKDESGRARKLPGLVQMGLIVGDIVEIEDWNEYGELKQHVKIVPIDGFKTAPPPPPVKAASTSKPTSGLAAAGKAKPKEAEKGSDIPGAQPTAFTLAMRNVGEEAAAKAKETKKVMTKTFESVGKAVETVVKGSDGSSDEKTATDSTPSSAWSIYMDSVMQAEDGTWSHRSGSLEKESIFNIVDSREALQSPTSGTWKN